MFELCASEVAAGGSATVDGLRSDGLGNGAKVEEVGRCARGYRPCCLPGVESAMVDVKR